MRTAGFVLDPLLFDCPTCGHRAFRGCVAHENDFECCEPHQARIERAVAAIMDAVEAWKAATR